MAMPLMSERLKEVRRMLDETHEEIAGNEFDQRRLEVKADELNVRLLELRREKHDLEDRIKRAKEAIKSLANG